MLEVSNAPYVYQRISSDSPALDNILGNEIRFRVDDANPMQMYVGNGQDFLPRSSFRTSPNLIGSAIVIVITLPFFLLIPIVLLVSFLRNKKKKAKPSHFNWINAGLILCGTLLIVNNLVSLSRILLINMFRASSEIAPHIWINYILVGLAIVLFGGSLLVLNKGEVTIKRKVFYATTVLLITSLIFILHSWNFFVIL